MSGGIYPLVASSSQPNRIIFTETMAWTGYQYFIAVLMVVTGSINTIATKWADEGKADGRVCIGNGNDCAREFNHPFLQASGMFFGEFLCFVAFKIIYAYYRGKNRDPEKLPDLVKGNSRFNPLIFLPPALCDMTATSLGYIGLNLTSSSSFQMLRGSLIVFTGLLTVTVIRRKLKYFQWIGIVIVTGGLVIVGLNDMLFSESSSSNASNELIGDCLIIASQVVASIQMIVEEKFVMGYNVSALQAVGWEGIFGFSILTTLLIPMYFIKIDSDIFKSPDHRIEDAIDGLYQIYNSYQIAIGLFGTVMSIAFFNFAGISVTKQFSATTRTVLDSVRTLIIWVFSLLIGDEKFSFVKLAGFVVLLIGMSIYNDVLIRPLILRALGKEPEPRPRTKTVIDEDDDEPEEGDHQHTVHSIS